MAKFQKGDFVLDTSENRKGIVTDVLSSWSYYKNGKKINKRMVVYIVMYENTTVAYAIAQKSNLLKKVA